MGEVDRCPVTQRGRGGDVSPASALNNISAQETDENGFIGQVAGSLQLPLHETSSVHIIHFRNLQDELFELLQC